MKEYKPNTAYPVGMSWQDVMEQLKHLNGKSMWIELELTPDLFKPSVTGAAGVCEALRIGYLGIFAKLQQDGNVSLCVLIDENMGDEDGFGVEPDDYLVGTVSPDGTFIERLHLQQ